MAIGALPVAPFRRTEAVLECDIGTKRNVVGNEDAGEWWLLNVSRVNGLGRSCNVIVLIWQSPLKLEYKWEKYGPSIVGFLMTWLGTVADKFPGGWIS